MSDRFNNKILTKQFGDIFYIFDIGWTKINGQVPYFSITGVAKAPNKYGNLIIDSCGCLHEEFAKIFPQFEFLVKYHLTSIQSPLHYVSNSLYHAKELNLEAARASAIWAEAELKDFTEANLIARLPGLMDQFKADLLRADIQWPSEEQNHE